MLVEPRKAHKVYPASRIDVRTACPDYLADQGADPAYSGYKAWCAKNDLPPADYRTWRGVSRSIKQNNFA